MSTFGSLLRHFRLEAKLSQEALAERARVSVETIGALERGARRSPYRDTLALLVEALGLGGEDRMRLEAAADRPSLRAVSDPDADGAAFGHNLPAELSTLVGREGIITEIGAFTAAHRLVTLVGSEGVGKTRLALRVAENSCPLWRDGVWLVELAGAGRAGAVEEAIAQALCIASPLQRPLLDVIVASLHRKHMLLVLDGCDRTIGDVAGASVAILRGCPDVGILATAREPLNVSGERTYRVPALASPRENPSSAAEAAAYPAVALFVERAQATGGGFVLSDDNAAAVGEICRRLDGIPLAIESAAARVRSIAPRQLLKLLDGRFDLHAGRCESSFTLLSESERVLARRLAIFPGRWTLEAAEAVCSDSPLQTQQVLELLASLVAKSLVTAEFSGGDATYRYLASMHALSLDRLTASGERDAIAQRHEVWLRDNPGSGQE